MDFLQAASAIESEFPRQLKSAFQRAGFAISAFVEAYIDERGPTRYPSPSDRWGAQTGRASRSLIPGQTGNITRIESTGGAPSLTFGTNVFYFEYLEEGTRFMRARPALRPGFTDFNRQLWPRLLSEAVQKTFDKVRV